jgi:hypothetical protein
MSKEIIPMRALFAAVALLTILIGPAFAQNNQDQNNNNQGRSYGAPGPIAGAGLPFLAIGYSVYWLVKRRRRQAD